MIKLKVNNREVTLFKDTAIKLISRVKDVRDVSKVFDDFTYEFSVPADSINNEIFNHIVEGSVVGGDTSYRDFHVKQPASVEIGSLSYKSGFVKYIKGVKTQGVLTHHKLKYMGGVISIVDTLGNLELSELDLGHLDHVTDHITVRQGMDNTQSLLENKVIYPLMSTSPIEVTADTLYNTVYTPTDFAPALLVTEIMDAIGSAAGVSLEYDDELTCLDNLYFWCSKKVKVEDIEANTSERTVMTFTPDAYFYQGYVSPYVNPITGLINVGTVGLYDNIDCSFNITTASSTSYTIQAYAGNSLGQEWALEGQAFTLSGNNSVSFNFTLAELSGASHIKFIVTSEEDMSMDYTMNLAYKFGSTINVELTESRVGLSVSSYSSAISNRLPKGKAIDFFKGILKLYNLIPVADKTTGSNTITLYTYVRWREVFGTTVDITPWVDQDNTVITLPNKPKEVSFTFEEPSTATAIEYSNITGSFFGDFIQSNTGGDGDAFAVELPFENLVWDKLVDTNMLVGKPVKPGGTSQDLDVIFNGMYLMYWNTDGASGNIWIDGVATPITQYKMCNSYNNDYTEGLTFKEETDQFTRVLKSINNYDKYYSPYLEAILNPTTRYFALSAFIPAAELTRIHLASYIIIGEEQYTINSISTDSLTGKTSLELINRYDAVPRPITPPDTIPPTIGNLRVLTNALPSVPINLVPSSVSGTDFTLSWDASTSESTTIDGYEVFMDGVSYSTTPTNSIDINGLVLGSYHVWTVRAFDAEGQVSPQSIGLAVQMFNSTGGDGEDAYTVILSNEAHTLFTDNLGVTSYTGSGTTIQVYKGSNELDGIVTGTPILGQFKVSATGYNITVGSLNAGTPLVVNDHSNMDSNSANVLYTIELEGLLIVNKEQTFSKALAGADGTGVTIIGSVTDSSQLDPSYTGNVGDMFIAQDTGHGWVWNGSTWDDVGQIQGPQGPSGSDGTDGADGTSTYFHVAYADDINGGGFSQDPLGKSYIGTYVDDVLADSSDPTDYTWMLVQGLDGADGIPGTNGVDGLTSYLHIAYSNSADGTLDFSVDDATGRTYLGQYTDFTLDDSLNPSDYTWQLVQGADGQDGADGIDGNDGIQGPIGPSGQTSYFHVAYADTDTGGGFSQSPEDKLYIGTYVDFTQADSSNPSLYAWTLIQGADGADGIAGTNGIDGQTSYLHIAYASSSDGSLNFSVSDPTGRDYLGTYVDFTVADSTTPSDYSWQLVAGSNGDDGIDGIQSTSGYVYYELSDDDMPTAPTADKFIFADFKFIGLTTKWHLQPPVATGGETYWYSYFTVTEEDPGAGFGEPTFSEPQIYLAFQNLVSFVDLSTGGQSTIHGSNITTGQIKSANYIAGSHPFSVQGTLIDLPTGYIESKNFGIDADGNIFLKGGVTSDATITGGTLSGASINGGTIGIGWNTTFNVYNFEVDTDGSISSYGGMYLGDGSDLSLSTNSDINLGALSSITGSRVSISSFNGVNVSEGASVQVASNSFYGTSSGAYLDVASFFQVDGELRATGNIIGYYSDDRLKTKTGIIEDALSRINKLDGFTYVENSTAKSLGFSNSKEQVGLSAQQVLEVLPQAVHRAPFDTAEDGSSKSGEDYLTVDYTKLVPLLIQGMKELSAKVRELETKLNR